MGFPPIPLPGDRRWPLAIGFGVLGLALNSLLVEIYSGIYLLLGHPAVVAAAVLLGPAAGAIAGGIAAAATVFYFGHPWALVVFALEGLAIGAWSRRHLPAVASGLFWLLAAVPYGLALRLEYPAGVVAGIVAKTVAEAVLGALGVQVVLLAPRIRRIARPLLPAPLLELRTRTLVRSVVLLSALLPLVVLGVVGERQAYSRRLAEIDRANLSRAHAAGHAIARLIDRSRYELAEVAATEGDRLQGLLLREPLVREAAIVDGGRVVQSAVRRPGDPGVAHSLRLPPPGTTVAEAGVTGSEHPALVVAEPLRDGTVLLAILDADRLGHVLAARAREASRLYLLGTTGRVLATTTGEAPDEAMQRAIASAGAPGTAWYLADPGSPRSLRPQANQRIAVSLVEPFGFRVVFAEAQYVLQPLIEAEALRLFGGFAVAVVMAVAAGLLMGRIVVHPVDVVARATRRLRRGERGARVDELGCEAPVELQALAEGFNRLAEEVERELAAVDRANRSRDAFLSVASHELKTPLAILKAQIQLIDRRPQEPHDRQLRTINRQLDRLNRLITQLLDAAALGPESLQLEPKVVELSRVVRRVAEDLQAVWPGREIRLDLAPVCGTCDELRIEQVLHNLVGNALKYSPADRPVEVTLRERPDGGVLLRIEDRGDGIPPEVRARLFQRFSRGDPSAGDGLGVGLYVVRRIVEGHGGTVTLAPREGGGTVATVQLPPAPRPADGGSG